MPGNTHNQQSDNISRLQHKIKELEGKLLDYSQMEQQMEEGEHRFRQILTLTYDGIIIYEKDSGKILEVNQRLVHKLQYLLKDVIGNSVLQFVIPEQREILTKRLKEDLPDVYEAVFVGKDGVHHEFEICSRSCMYRGQKVKMAAVSDVSYKKYYEKILKESEERFRSLSENTDDSIILVNGQDIIYANPSTSCVFDIKISELSDLSQVLANVHTEDIDCFSALIKDIISGKRQNQACQFRILSDENKVRWIWSRVFPVVPNTNDTRLVLQSSDITDMQEKEEARKKMEIAAKTAEEKYKILTSLLPEIIIETDTTGKLTFASLRTIEVFEYGSDLYTNNLCLHDLIIRKDRERCKDFFKKTIAGEVILESEYTAITKSGYKFPVTIHATRMYSDGELVGLSVVMFDITKEKHAERKALSYQENMLFLSNSALKFLTFSDEDDIFIFIGKSISKIVPKSVVIVFSYDQSNNISHIRYISGIHSQTQRVITALGKPPEDFSIELPRKFKNKYLSKKILMKLNGLEDAVDENWPKEPLEEIQKILHLHDYYAMGMSRRGKLYGGLLLATKTDDETVETQLIETFVYQAGIALHRKQVETELMRAKLAAEESDRLKSAFLANMSHEVRTPLNGILGLAQLLLKTDIDKTTHDDYVKMIVESGNSLLSLIEDIMDVSKIEAKQMKIKYKPFKINDLMDHLFSVFLANPLYVQKNEGKQRIELKCNKQVENLTLLSDPERLQQILINLIGNAIKFTQDGTVEFGYELKKDKILFYVRDSGIGIPKDKAEKIFERFIQVDSTLARKFSGSGLGLAISKGLIDLLDGEIWVESDLGKGSTFFFTVPYYTTSFIDSSLQPEKENPVYYNWEGYTLLMVEDDKINSRVVEAMLRNTKIRVIHVDNGKKAIETVRDHPEIDIVLMDMHLPELSGLEATRIILKDRADLPVIAQTANAMSEDKDRCIDAGCVDYIGKPINMDDLYFKISRYLPERKA